MSGNAEFNARFWGGQYDWSGRGEEWSAMWGNSRAQWLGSLYPRVSAFLPARSVVEIAPGYGRWTRFLLAACDRYQGFDVSQECIDACKQRFAIAANARFMTTDGKSFPGVDEASVDFLFSFDSLVHASSDVMAAYAEAVLRILAPKGAAFIHHSNWLDSGDPAPNPHGRGADVSAALVRQYIEKAGGRVWIQEKINWGSQTCIDCLTLFGREGPADPVVLENLDFMREAVNIRNHQSPYSKLAIESAPGI